MGVQRIHKLGCGHRRIRRCKPAAGNKIIRERYFVGFQQSIPTRFPDYYTVAHLQCVRQKLAAPNDWYFQCMSSPKSRCTVDVTIRHFVHPLDQVASFLKFDRKEESARGIVALPGDAYGVAIATGNLLRPEIK